ncbi:hypothetical protein [Hymenobacter sp. IS2118]|uniref:hypothetical protein n=1 Tax=Hymenobacter sp. IS2118 TaxID=1505605 RepID=UPI0005584CE7|nr:hypothetical protein [Hymenobacter sp. IS2118]
MTPAQTAEINAHFHRYNAAPLAEFCGLSPTQMHQLMSAPLGVASPVRLRAELPASVLDRVPLLRLIEELLRLVQRENSIKLTAGGALPRKFLHELYAHRLVPEEYVDAGFISINREIDSPVLHTTHIIAMAAGLVKKVHGKLTITKKGQLLQAPAQRPALLRLVLEVFTEKFNWGYFDGFGDDDSPVGQLAWAYSVYLLVQFGPRIHPISFYADNYLLAFPFLLNSVREVPYMTREEKLGSYYAGRVMFRFAKWFGLVEIDEQKFGFQAKPDEVTATALVTELFEVNVGAKA